MLRSGKAAGFASEYTVQRTCRDKGFAGLMITKTRIIATALAGSMLLGTGAPAVARPRELPPRWKDLSRPTAETDVWLRRLAGRFRYEGSLTRPEADDFISVKGLGDCVNVGVGPGVQCIFSLEWPPPLGFSMEPVAVANLNPAMVLYGVDPGIPGMRYLQVNQKGLAEGGAGSIRGDTATFQAACVNTGTIMRAGNVLRGLRPPGVSAGGGPSSTAAASTSSGGDAGSSGADTGLDSSADSGFDTGADPINSQSGGMLDMSTGFTAGADLFGGCMKVTRIEARADAAIIWMRIDIGDPMIPAYSFSLSLYRIPKPGGEATN